MSESLNSFDCDFVEMPGAFPRVIISAEVCLLHIGRVETVDLEELKKRIVDAVAETVTMENIKTDPGEREVANG